MPCRGGDDEAAIIRGWMDGLADENSVLHQRARANAVDMTNRVRCDGFELSKESKLGVGALGLAGRWKTRQAARRGLGSKFDEKLGQSAVLQDVDDVGVDTVGAAPGHELDGAEGVAALGQERLVQPQLLWGDVEGGGEVAAHGRAQSILVLDHDGDDDDGRMIAVSSWG